MAAPSNTKADQTGQACAAGGHKPPTGQVQAGSLDYEDIAGGSFSVCPTAQNIAQSSTVHTNSPELVSVLSKLDLDIGAIGNLAFFEVNSLHNSDVENITKVYIRYIQRLLMFDHRVRDGLPHDINASKTSPDSGKTVVNGNSLRRSLKEKKSVIPAKGLHPSDALLGILLCCNAVLRQIIFQRLYTCKLAVPWLFPKFQPRVESFPALWSLRGLIGSCHQTGVPLEVSVNNVPMHIITFVRFDKIPFSKSAVLNELSGIKHPTFHTCDCPSGRLKRLISNGTVEAGFRLSYNHSSDNTHMLMFKNLRGDAFDPECSQALDLLTKLSQSMVIFFDQTTLNGAKRTEQMVRSFNDKCNQFFIVLTSFDSETLDSHIESLDKRENIEMCPVEKNDKLIEIVDSVDDFLQRHDASVSLRNLQNFDRDIRHFEGECLVNNFHTSLDTAKSLDNVLLGDTLSIFLKHLRKGDLGKTIYTTSAPKLNLLHLQTGIWPELASIHRTMCKSTEKSKSKEKEYEIKKKRKEMFSEIMSSGSLEFTTLLNVIHHLINDGAFKTGSTRSLELLLRCYKVCLDDRCHKVIPSLRAEWGRIYHSHSQTSDLESAEKEKLQTLLNACEERMEDESFGVEHLLREMGQFYEALVDPYPSTYPGIEAIQLLEAATSMLLLGHPFELIVGDYNVNGIPLVWVRAVLEKLASVIDNKKVLVVSILGNQSSGKSTLLNAMFGVQFAVSAGRCTKGVFMQLVKVSDPNLAYKYIVIIDTEGLRANEIERNIEHDNELATFAIGVGDVTIVNVKGENIQEMTDVLQIATLAFLRMKNVSPNLQLHQRCIFVHQNVSEPNANEKLMIGRRVLVTHLDDIARKSAIAEGMEGIKQFSDVIQFDLIKDVWYFPDLWVGTPPMDYVSPAYVKSVLEVRRYIVENTKTSGFLRLSELIARISDLWIAILSDDFVFYFRNHLELKSHGELELCYAYILADVNLAFTAMINESEVKVLKADSTDALRDVKCKCVNILENHFQKTKDEAVTKLKYFFETHDHRNIVSQWYHERMRMLSSELEHRLCQSSELIEYISDIAQQKFRTHELIYDFEEKICALAENTGKLVKLKQDQMTKYRKDFDTEGQLLISEYLTKIPMPETVETEAITMSEFVAMFPSKFTRFVRTALEEDKLKNLTYQNVVDKVKNYEAVFDRIDFYESDPIMPGHLLEVTRYCLKLLTEAAAGLTADNPKLIHLNISQYIKARVKMLIETFSQCNAGKRPSIEMLNDRGQAKMHVLQYYCIQDNFSLISLSQASKHNVDVRGHFVRFLDTAWDLALKISTGSNVTRASYFLQLAIVESIQNKIHKELYNDGVERCSDLLSGGKLGLLGEIFTALARSDSHEPLLQYIDNPKQYALIWMADLFNRQITCTENKMQRFLNKLIISMKRLRYLIAGIEEQDKCDFKNLYDLAKDHAKRLVGIVRTGLNQTNITGDINQWVEDLRNYLISNKFVVPVGAFSRVAHIGDSMDCVCLQKEVATHFDEIYTQVKAHFKNVISSIRLKL